MNPCSKKLIYYNVHVYFLVEYNREMWERKNGGGSW